MAKSMLAANRHLAYLDCSRKGAKPSQPRACYAFWFNVRTHAAGSLNSAASLLGHNVSHGESRESDRSCDRASSDVGMAIALALPGRGVEPCFHKGTEPEAIILSRLLVSPAKFLLI